MDRLQIMNSDKLYCRFFFKKNMYIYIYTGILIIVHVCVYIYFCLVDG